MKRGPALNVVQTERLLLRRLSLDDTGLIVAVLNDPDFVRFVGDRRVRTPEDARRYLADGPLASYARHGFGLYAVALRGDGTGIGICGLLQREHLPDPDVGFAFLPAWRSQGFAREAARAVLEHAEQDLALPRVLAIVDPENGRSVRLLQRLGLSLARMLPAEDGGLSLACYEIAFGSKGARAGEGVS